MYHQYVHTTVTQAFGSLSPKNINRTTAVTQESNIIIIYGVYKNVPVYHGTRYFRYLVPGVRYVTTYRAPQNHG